MASSVSHERLAKEMSLKQMLDGLTLAHRQDIHAFGGGHLNEANLAKPPEKATHKSWGSALKETPTLVPRGRLPPKKPLDTTNLNKMTKTMANFSLGTLGTIPVPPLRKSEHTRISTKPHSSSTRSSKIASAQQASLDKVNGHVHIEELKLPEVMLAKTEYPISRAETQIRESSPTGPSVGWTRDISLLQMRHDFLPGRQEAVTKKDQYNHFRDFETGVIRKHDTLEREVLSGIKAVDHLERKLQEVY